MNSLFWFIGLPIIMATTLYLLKFLNYKIYYTIFQVLFLGYTFSGFLFVRRNNNVIDVLGDYDKGIGIALHLDKLSSSFILLNVFLFTCFILFNIHKAYVNKLFLFLFYILQGLINGIFLSYDLFNIYLLMELSTVVVSILIMFKKDKQSMYDGLLYLLTNIVSMAFFLLGIGYIYKIFGSMDLSVISEQVNLLDNGKYLLLPYSLLITAVCLKSAVMPLFSWLPRAHGTPSAPSIVSAVLSGIYIKASLYLFIRLHDVFAPLINTDSLFLFLGILTAIIGFIISISQDDIKLILAYSTVSQVGLIIIGLSLNNSYGINGGLYHIFNHAIAKSILFLCAGIMIESYKTRDINKIRGVLHNMPIVGIVTIIAILSITGAPLFGGSYSKYLIQKGAKSTQYVYELLYLINFGTILIMLKFSNIFLGKSEKKEDAVRWNQTLVLSLLAIVAFLSGVLGDRFSIVLFNIDNHVDITSLLDKGISYIIMVLLGIVFYRYLYPRLKRLSFIKDFEFSFNQTIFSLVLFFVFIYSYLNI